MQADPIQRIVTVYLPETLISGSKKQDSWNNKLFAQCIYRAIDSHQALSKTKVSKNIQDYGKWLVAQKTEAEEQRNAAETPEKPKLTPAQQQENRRKYSLKVLESCLPTNRCEFEHVRKETSPLQLIQSVLFLNEMLMKFSSDLVGPLYVILKQETDKARLPLVAMAVARFRAELAETIKSQKQLKNMPRVAVITLSEDRATHNQAVFDHHTESIQVLKEVPNLFYANLYLNSPQMCIEEPPPRKNFMTLDLSQLSLKAPLEYEFAYLFRNLIAAELRNFTPDIIVIEDTLPILKQTINLKALALMLNSAVEVSNCKVFYVKWMGADWKQSASPETVNSVQKNRVNCFKNLMFKECSVVLQSLYEVIDVEGIKKLYFDQSLDERFLQCYSELADRVSKDPNKQQTSRLQVSSQLKLSSTLHEDAKKVALFLPLSYRPTSLFCNLQTGELEQSDLVVGRQQQYYVHYGHHTLIYLFHKDYFQVYRGGEKQLELVGGWRPSRDQLKGYSVIDSCLVASDRFLYRMFGRYSGHYQYEGSQPVSKGPLARFSDKIFYINLDYDQNRPIDQRFAMREFEPKYEKNNPRSQKVEGRCNSAGFYVQQSDGKGQVFVIGGHLESASEDTICRNGIVIENDKSLYSFDKLSEEALLMMFKDRKLRIRPSLYCLPFPVRKEDTEVAVLGTNAFTYEHLQKDPLSLYRFHADTHHRKSSYVTKYEPIDNIKPLVEAKKQMIMGTDYTPACMDRKAFDRAMMFFVVRSTQAVNRYEREGDSLVSIYDPEQQAHVVMKMKKNWELTFQSNDEEVEVTILRDDGSKNRLFVTDMTFRNPPSASKTTQVTKKA